MNAHMKSVNFVLMGVMLLASVVLAVNGMHLEAFALANGAAVVPSLEDLATEFAKKNKEFSEATAGVKTLQADVESKFKAGEKISSELKAAIDEALTKFNGAMLVVNELEQKMASRVELEQKTAKTWGEQVAESPLLKGMLDAGQSGTARISVKQVTSAAAGGLIRSLRESDVVGLPQQRRVMRDLLRTVPIKESSVEYAKQTTRTNNAAMVAEGAVKPYSDYVWTSETVVVRTLAHLAKLTRQAMDDAPRLMGEIDQEMRYGLGYVEERQFLYGNNTGQNLNGIVPQATAFAKPAGYVDAKATRIDVLRLAMLQTTLSLFPADGIVVNETDWALIELTKTTEGAYLFANPQGAGSPRMWGLPVVATPAMVADSFLVGAFQIGATVYDRMAIEVLISTENADDFEKNLITVRAEERVAIAVKRPSAFITGDFSDAIASIIV